MLLIKLHLERKFSLFSRKSQMQSQETKSLLKPLKVEKEQPVSI